MSNKPKHNVTILEYKESATHCFYCETLFEDIEPGMIVPIFKTIDHFIPLNHRGLNHNRNKVICCGYCNHLKSCNRPGVFLDLLAGKDKR
jgi:uncharacterized CHY-type Zn-finger protein